MKLENIYITPWKVNAISKFYYIYYSVTYIWVVFLDDLYIDTLLYYLFKYNERTRFYGVMVSTLDSESNNPSSSLGRTCSYFTQSLNSQNNCRRSDSNIGYQCLTLTAFNILYLFCYSLNYTYYNHIVNNWTSYFRIVVNLTLIHFFEFNILSQVFTSISRALSIYFSYPLVYAGCVESL